MTENGQNLERNIAEGNVKSQRIPSGCTLGQILSGTPRGLLSAMGPVVAACRIAGGKRAAVSMVSNDEAHILSQVRRLPIWRLMEIACA